MTEPRFSAPTGSRWGEVSGRQPDSPSRLGIEHVFVNTNTAPLRPSAENEILQTCPWICP
jgi:hypothetical protein